VNWRISRPPCSPRPLNGLPPASLLSFFCGFRRAGMLCSQPKMHIVLAGFERWLAGWRLFGHLHSQSQVAERGGRGRGVRSVRGRVTQPIKERTNNRQVYKILIRSTKTTQIQPQRILESQSDYTWRRFIYLTVWRADAIPCWSDEVSTPLGMFQLDT